MNIDWLKWRNYLVTLIFAASLIVLVLGSTLEDNLQKTNQCPSDCQCQNEVMSCHSLSETILNIPETVKRIIIEERRLCNSEIVKNLIKLAATSDLNLDGTCSMLREKDPVFLNELVDKNYLENSDFDDESQRLKKATQNSNSVYSFNIKPVTFHKCIFNKSDCGWKQLEGVDFLNWRRNQYYGYELQRFRYQKPDYGQFADMIGPPMIKPHQVKSVTVRLSYRYNGIYNGAIDVIVIYPRYSQKIYKILSLSITSNKPSYTIDPAINIFKRFSPLYQDYQIIIRGKWDSIATVQRGPIKFIISGIIIWAEEKTCYTGTGQSYRGTVKESSNGTRCLHWASDGNPYQSFSKSEEVTSNYCRNPNSVRDRPWCYTSYSSNSSNWELEDCSIPQCQDNTTDTVKPPYPLEKIKYPLSMNYLDNNYKYGFGRPSIYIDGNWRLICDDRNYPPKRKLSSKALDLICRQMGLGIYGSRYSYPSGIESGVCNSVNDFFCPSDAKSFSECTVNSSVQIYHSTQYSLQCYPSAPHSILSTISYALSISNGTFGIVQIRYGSQTGGICRDGWNTYSADVVCRELGFAAASSDKVIMTGATYPAALITSVNCEGYEKSLSQCHVTTASTKLCTKTPTATISCIPHQTVYDFQNQPANCSFIKGFCGWKSMGSLPWIWHNGNHKGHYNPTVTSGAGSYYIYVKRFPYTSNSTTDTALLVSPSFTPEQGPITMYFYDYELGTSGENVTWQIRYRTNSGQMGTLKSGKVIYLSPITGSSWGLRGYIERKFNPQEDFRIEIEFTFHPTGTNEPSSRGIMLNRFWINNAKSTAFGRASSLFQATNMYTMITILVCVVAASLQSVLLFGP